MNMIPRIDLDTAIESSRWARLYRLAQSAKSDGCHSSVMIPIEPPTKVFIRDILKAFCEQHAVTRDAILGNSRVRGLCYLRHALYFKCATDTGVSLAEIGRRLNRDHTSIINGIRRHCERNGLPLPRGMKA